MLHSTQPRAFDEGTDNTTIHIGIERATLLCTGTGKDRLMCRRRTWLWEAWLSWLDACINLLVTMSA